MAEHGLTYSEIGYGMVLWFQSKVVVLESHFTITGKTLITRIGGVIGVGQVLTWLLNRGFDYLSVIYTKFRDSQHLRVNQ